MKHNVSVTLVMLPVIIYDMKYSNRKSALTFISKNSRDNAVLIQGLEHLQNGILHFTLRKLSGTAAYCIKSKKKKLK
jgi:hypothetical protein